MIEGESRHCRRKENNLRNPPFVATTSRLFSKTEQQCDCRRIEMPASFTPRRCWLFRRNATNKKNMSTATPATGGAATSSSSSSVPPKTSCEKMVVAGNTATSIGPTGPKPVPDPAAVETINDNTTYSSVNDFREKHNLPRVEPCPSLQSMADAHCLSMSLRQTVDHQGFVPDRARRGARVENVAMGHDTETAVTTAWSRSSGHRQNMLKSNLTKYGLGRYCNDKTKRTYWCLIMS